MALNKDFLMGFVSGTVVGAVGYRLYEQNGGELKNLIQQVPQIGGFGASEDPAHATPTVEELMEQKERLEDLIAEQESVE